ncbi:diacylglycerol O-acyltransferase 2D isoform X2 [Elaeis guineensis]|uniref:diacylglycerol O-acyltransferase 2D isoform X2 n=1 Tax=Elaeis guineensis var. tenera TaxID=51953 RepID=UPI003C6D6C1B
MEDARAFDQNKAYVLAAEPHSVFPIGCLSLLSFTGLMPLSKTKALASTAVAYLKRRYGFVQVAIETGSPLVPVFCFGQSNVYKWWKPQGKFYVHVARAIRFAPLIFWGVLGSPVPYRKPIHIIVGRPIEIKQNLNPSREEVAEVHARFISAMEKLFVRLQHRGTVKNAVLCLYQNFLSQS